MKVIDKESESAEFTGIKGDKEKVMDVELKEEYKSGWFGNAKLSGGTTASGKDDNGFKERKDLLFSGSAMVSAYGERNQLTTIANGYVQWHAQKMAGGDELELGCDKRLHHRCFGCLLIRERGQAFED